MKSALTAWGWSLKVLVRSPLALLVLAAVAALWGLAAYQWLWIPESSLLMLTTTVVGALLLIAVGLVVVAGTAAGAARAAGSGEQRLSPPAFWKVGWKQLASTFLLALASFVLVILLAWILGGINRWSVEVASFLTFHAEKPVSHVVIEAIYWVIGALIWMAVGGFLLSLLIGLLASGWSEARKNLKKTLASCLYRRGFVISLLSVLVFGGLAYRLAVWHPITPVGFWDYAQMAARFAAVLVLLAAGWLVWLLALARLQFSTRETPPR